MAEQKSHFYEFGRFRLDTRERVLLRDRDLVPLTPKVFEILLALVEQNGHVVEKDYLMKRVWPDAFVEEGNLTQNVSLLRKALGETTGGWHYIETISRRGYRFVATVKEWPENGENQRGSPAVVQNDLTLNQSDHLSAKPADVAYFARPNSEAVGVLSLEQPEAGVGVRKATPAQVCRRGPSRTTNAPDFSRRDCRCSTGG
jgi:DNA-binding winged helix-turn-helix (wHTH) protein